MRKIIVTTILGVILASTNSVVLATGETLKWVGCGITKHAFMERLTKAYELKTGVQIDLAGGGATRGIRDISSLNADIGATCRLRLPGHGEERGVRLVPLAWDALVVITHQGNPVDNITQEQLRSVLTGKIVNWQELGGPDQPIQLMIRESKNSGVGHELRRLLFSDMEQEFLGGQRFASSGPLEQAVEKAEWSLGITGISSAHKRAVKLLAMDGVQPSMATLKNAEYPLFRPLYLVTNARSENRKQVSEFVDFALSREGRTIIKRAGTLPYYDGLGLIRKIAQLDRYQAF